jgi:hypothetical protein
MKKYLTLIVAALLSASLLTPITMKGAGGADAQMPKEVSKEDAVKKYPPPAGKASYPAGMPAGLGASVTDRRFVQSPYSSHTYDCKGVKHGALLLDESVNKVFVRP